LSAAALANRYNNPDHHTNNWEQSTMTINTKSGLTTFDAVGLAEGFIEAESEDQIIEAWQYLHDTGVAYQLQGWFGRTASDLIAQGVING
jgi:hypothetical protein